MAVMGGQARLEGIYDEQCRGGEGEGGGVPGGGGGYRGGRGTEGGGGRENHLQQINEKKYVHHPIEYLQIVSRDRIFQRSVCKQCV